jgi:NADH-quinone oxidoreductase subunit N
MVGFALVLFAFAFKMSAVPFHFWAPDVYSGAPTVITAYMSTIVKIGAIAGFYRLFLTVISNYSEHRFEFEFYTKYIGVMLLIAILTITVGNIIAATQTNVKRLLAYSSIGHAGFILLGITMLTESTTAFTWYYLFAYSLASLASFSVLMIVSKENNSEDISAFNGLVKRNPILAGTMTIALLSMAGIPPMAGFFAKYFILMNVIGKGYILIAVMAILVSLIGVYYYFKIIIAMFTGVAQEVHPISISGFNKIILLFISLLIILVGVAPDFVLQFILR